MTPQNILILVVALTTWCISLITADGIDLLDEEETSSQTIIGGEEIERGSRPYLISVSTGIGDEHVCGGSLVSPHAVLTAAHCLFYDEVAPVLLWFPPHWVDINRFDMCDDGDVDRVYLGDRTECDGNVLYHPKYNHATNDYDVAVIILPIAVDHITPVLLNTDPNVPADGDPLDVSGWGNTDPKHEVYLNTPRAVTVNYITNEACTTEPYKYADSEITDQMICAYKKNKDSCQNDSGKYVYKMILLQPSSSQSIKYDLVTMTYCLRWASCPG